MLVWHPEIVGNQPRRQLERSGSAATSLQKELDATKADLRKCQDERSRALLRAESDIVDARRASDLTSKSEKEAIEKRLKQAEEALRVVRVQASPGPGKRHGQVDRQVEPR